jgi:putative ABC transport system permease protein
MAVVLVVVAVVADNIALMQTRTGVPESQIAMIQSVQTDIGASRGGLQAALDALRAVPGVRAAALGDAPLWNVRKVSISKESGPQAATLDVYGLSGSQGLCQALELVYTSGEAIADVDLPDVSTLGPGTVFPMVITEALAYRLFGADRALGRRLYFGSQSGRVVGVVRHLRGAITGSADDDYAFVLEFRAGNQDMGGGFVIRADADNLNTVLAAASKALHRVNPNHVQQTMQTMGDLRRAYFRDRSATAWLLVYVAFILVSITIGGVAGLGAYSVQQRRSQIGVRRALGARRKDIVGYYLLENAIVMVVGVCVGACLAFAGSSYMTLHYGIPRLHRGDVGLAAVILIAIGQLAALWPALKAASVPPAAAINGL